MKKIFIHGFVAGILSATMSVIYFKLYQTTLGTSFDKIINIGSIIGSSIFGCLIMAVGYFILFKLRKENLKAVVNVIISVLSFTSIIGIISMTLPLEIETPELFPGLAVPMHFFPALAFFALDPFFKQQHLESVLLN
jgi:L-cystine uptake protein TcyP (sodium:dicarboxylate symporter family)